MLAAAAYRGPITRCRPRAEETKVTCAPSRRGVATTLSSEPRYRPCQPTTVKARPRRRARSRSTPRLAGNALPPSRQQAQVYFERALTVCRSVPEYPMSRFG